MVYHATLTLEEWNAISPDYRGVVTQSEWTGWPVGTHTMLVYDPQHGTCLVPVLVLPDVQDEV